MTARTAQRRRVDLATAAGQAGRRARRALPASPRRCAGLLNKVFPDHWSFLLGEIALYSFIVLLLTGTFLALLLRPVDDARSRYNGSYAPLRGVEMSAAYDDGAEHLVRRARRPGHAADAPLGGAAVHGRDRRAHVPGLLHRRVPQAARGQLDHRRDLLFCSASLEGFAGYSLPDDLLSGTGLRIASAIMLSIPVIGTWVTTSLFGGEFPGDEIIAAALHRPRAADPGDPARR